MRTITIKIDKEEKRLYGETRYQVFYGGWVLFEFVNRFKGLWYFYNGNGNYPFAEIKTNGVPFEEIKNLATAFATISDSGKYEETEIVGDKVVVNRKAEDYEEQGW